MLQPADADERFLVPREIRANRGTVRGPYSIIITEMMGEVGAAMYFDWQLFQEELWEWMHLQDIPPYDGLKEDEHLFGPAEQEGDASSRHRR